MKKFIFLVLFSVSTAHARITFYTGDSCQGYSFDRYGGEESNLKGIYFEYPCSQTSFYGKDGEFDRDENTTCRHNFNDIIKSVELTMDQEVQLFKHVGFKGDSETLRGNGCHELRYLRNTSSSVRMFN